MSIQGPPGPPRDSNIINLSDYSRGVAKVSESTNDNTGDFRLRRGDLAYKATHHLIAKIFKNPRDAADLQVTVSYHDDLESQVFHRPGNKSSYLLFASKSELEAMTSDPLEVQTAEPILDQLHALHIVANIGVAIMERKRQPISVTSDDILHLGDKRLRLTPRDRLKSITRMRAASGLGIQAIAAVIPETPMLQDDLYDYLSKLGVSRYNSSLGVLDTFRRLHIIPPRDVAMTDFELGILNPLQDFELARVIKSNRTSE